MRLGVFILLNLIFATLAARADEILPVLKVGANVYSNVTITSVSATEIYFTSDRGMANAKLKNLEPALQKHFKYDAARADAVAEKQKAGNIAYSPPTAPVAYPTINRTNAQSIMDDATARVKAIVNQPVRQLALTPDMRDVEVSSPGWFHAGATKPNFNTVDVRTTRETKYGEHAYATSDVTPGVAFIGAEIEFNFMTKYFYVDRSLPKKKLTEPEMLEINRLYRVMGACETQLTLSQYAASATNQAPASVPGFLSLHKTAIIGVSLSAVLLLLGVRFFTGRQNS